MSKKAWLIPIKYPIPEDLEYYLEEMAAEGYILQPLGEKSLFFYEFEEGKRQKTKYMVDKSTMPMDVYTKMMLDRGWEYMGKSGNCVVWRQDYDEKRPEDCSDKFCKNRHTKNMGIIFLIIALLFVITAGALGYGFYYEKKMNAEYLHYGYILQAVLHLPFAIYFGIKAKKCLDHK